MSLSLAQVNSMQYYVQEKKVKKPNWNMIFVLQSKARKNIIPRFGTRASAFWNALKHYKNSKNSNTLNVHLFWPIIESFTNEMKDSIY